MATKGFTKNSTGQDFTQMSSGVTDLSDLAKDSILAKESMAGGNMVTDKQGPLQMAAPGIQSEQTATNLLGEVLAKNNVPDPADDGIMGHNPKEVHHG